MINFYFVTISGALNTHAQTLWQRLARVLLTSTHWITGSDTTKKAIEGVNVSRLLRAQQSTVRTWVGEREIRSGSKQSILQQNWGMKLHHNKHHNIQCPSLRCGGHEAPSSDTSTIKHSISFSCKFVYLLNSITVLLLLSAPSSRLHHRRPTQIFNDFVARYQIMLFAKFTQNLLLLSVVFYCICVAE